MTASWWRRLACTAGSSIGVAVQAAYAVAQAARYAATPLRILAEQPQVAETYIAVFCSTVEQPAPHGAGL